MLTFFGCSGGHGPTLPSPDGGDGGDDDIVDIVEYIVAAGETMRYDTDTVIQCDMVQIDGEVIGADGSAPGEDGCSITIECSGNVTINGTVQAGSGADNTDDEHGDTHPDGGDGGAVHIQSAEGDITLGPESRIASGNGGNGGGSLNGGAGGTGGDIRLYCAEGALTVGEHEGFMHIGNGGHGGDGNVHGEDLLTYELDEQGTNGGGDSGFAYLRFADVVGGEAIEVEHPEGTVQVVLIDEVALTGGKGGDAGAFYYGVDPETEESTWPEQLAPTAVSPRVATPEPAERTGDDGGNGNLTAGAGADVFVRGRPALGPGGKGGAARATGGGGGDTGVAIIVELGQHETLSIPGNAVFTSGRGGNALAIGAPGAPGPVPSGPGGSGGEASAVGGNGGTVIRSPIFPRFSCGDGGRGRAIGGRGGHGGTGCDYTGGGSHQTGGAGGWGGDAEAVGGDAGTVTPHGDSEGYAGSAQAEGGKAGNGAAPDGLAGFFGVAEASAGSGGRGPLTPPVQTDGKPGTNGGDCPAGPELFKALTRSLHSAANRYEIGRTVVYGPQNMPSALAPAQVGPRGPDWNWGPAVAMASDGSRLYAGTEDGIAVYTNPLNVVGTEPNFRLNPGGPGSGAQDCPSVALDETNDRLYAIYPMGDGSATWIWGWSNVSATGADREADFGARVPDVDANSIAAGPDHIVFLADMFHVYALDGVHLDSGTDHAPDRTMRYVSPGDLQPIAYDHQRDLLYMFHWIGDRGIRVIENASTADGDDLPLRVFTNSTIGFGSERVAAITCFPEDDLLFVANHNRRQIMVFANASTLEGPVDVTNQVYAVSSIENAAFYREGG